MKTQAIIFLIILSFISCQKKNDNKEQVILDRLENISSLKSEIDQTIWNGIDKEEYDVPIIYYTYSNCYVTNPTKKFKKIYNPNIVFENNKIKIYKTDSLIDNVGFHMETSILLGDSIPDYNYKSPFMNCSSFEITNKVIPEVSSTELWITMIIHEYFHGFQFKHKTFINYFEQNIAKVSADSLKNLYSKNLWFKESIDKENEYLLFAIESKSPTEISTAIASFFDLRKKRRNRAEQELKFDIQTIEENYETMEGTARYVEFKLYEKFSAMQPNEKLVKSDSSYHSFDYFKNYNIDKDKWLYLTNKTSYFYAIGFNMARLMDKLGIEYKSRLFKENGLTLEQIFSAEIKNVW